MFKGIQTKYYSSGNAISIDQRTKEVNIRNKCAVIGFTHDEFKQFLIDAYDFYKEFIADSNQPEVKEGE